MEKYMTNDQIAYDEEIKQLTREANLSIEILQNNGVSEAYINEIVQIRSLILEKVLKLHREVQEQRRI